MSHPVGKVSYSKNQRQLGVLKRVGKLVLAILAVLTILPAIFCFKRVYKLLKESLTGVQIKSSPAVEDSNIPNGRMVFEYAWIREFWKGDAVKEVARIDSIKTPLKTPLVH